MLFAEISSQYFIWNFNSLPFYIIKINILNIFRVKVLECSAKDDINIREIFRTFLTLSKIFPRDTEESGGLKRRSSAYVSATKGNRRAASPAPEKDKPSTSESKNTLSKPRSRSLIRRASRKTKQQMREAQNGSEDSCNVS